MTQKNNVTREEAENAVRTILTFIGENPQREGLKETPRRFIDAYLELFDGYNDNPDKVLAKTFAEIKYQKEMVLVKDIRVVSFCEHHVLPIIGKAHVAYIPDEKVVGISKLARLVDIYSRRLQTQEIMTSQLVESIEKNLKPKGTAVLISAYHFCMSIRGTSKPDSQTVTSQFSGVFNQDRDYKDDFYRLINIKSKTILTCLVNFTVYKSSPHSNLDA